MHIEFTQTHEKYELEPVKHNHWPAQIWEPAHISGVLSPSFRTKFTLAVDTLKSYHRISLLTSQYSVLSTLWVCHILENRHFSHKMLYFLILIKCRSLWGRRAVSLQTVVVWNSEWGKTLCCFAGTGWSFQLPPDKRCTLLWISPNPWPVTSPCTWAFHIYLEQEWH